MKHSDDAMRLAGEITNLALYPRFAELIRQSIENCTLDAEPLSDEQAEQIYRAAILAGDGAFEQIAHMIDHQTVLAFRRELDGEGGVFRGSARNEPT